MTASAAHTLVGHTVLLNTGNLGHISKIFDLADGVKGMPPRLIVEITLVLRENECHFEPKTGVSLTGQRLHPITELGKTFFVIT